MSLEIDPRNLGTLELDGIWVPYMDLHDDGEYMPARVVMARDEYGFQSSMIVQGHSAVLPQRVRELREAGKKSLVVERGNRYYLFASPP